MTRYIFVTGGVVSSLGKGIATSSLGALLQAHGYRVRLRKLDPYLNVDPGTMSPFQHGEVFVTDDGAESDLDLGHYERFTNVDAKKADNVTTGRIYSEVISHERRGDYLGATVQVIPHVTDMIKRFITSDTEDTDFILCEIGGTVGDIESLPFLEAIRQLGNELGDENCLFIHLTLLPYIPSAGERKTKPTQHSVKELLSVGIQPDILMCRSDQELASDVRSKISLFCNIKEGNVISAVDVPTIYAVPEAYSKQGLDRCVLKHFRLEFKEPDLSAWSKIVNRIISPESEVTIGIVGKYTSLPDAYKSLSEALVHGGIANNVRVNLKWLNSEIFEREEAHCYLQDVHGILIPGGFGERGAEGKIAAAKFARINNIPYFGICFGMQMAVIEVARNLLGLPGAGSTEFGPCEQNIVGLMTEWKKGDRVETRTEETDLGGTMRLGAYACKLAVGGKTHRIYGKDEISERHRHRYEVNIQYRQQLEDVGMYFTGLSPDGNLPEIVEIPDHPWFIGVQFHPELKSRPLDPHPLFASFIEAALKHSRLV
jgi:CTP synthase